MLINKFSALKVSKLIKITLLFSSSFFVYNFLFANQIGLLFKHTTINGIEWEKNGDPKNNAFFEGQIVNNYPNGIGKLTYPNGSSIEGYWEFGKLNGKGTFFWNDGRKYVGSFKNGKPIGQGTYFYSDGSKKKGTWANSQKNFFWENEKSYTKNFGKKTFGVLSYRKENARWGWFDYGEEKKDGKYIGEIENMKPNGFGKFTYGIGRWNGDKYQGMWRNGEFNGKGTLIKKNGEKFIGEWKNNQIWNISKFSKFGKILRKYENGIEVRIKSEIEIKKKYKQNIKKIKGTLFLYTPRSLWEDLGKEWSDTGDEKKHGKYEGEIFNGLPNGKGVYSWFNVNKYTGDFKNGMFHGEGTFYSIPSRVKIVGEFKKDKVWNATQTDEVGNIIGKYINGKLMKNNF